MAHQRMKHAPYPATGASVAMPHDIDVPNIGSANRDAAGTQLLLGGLREGDYVVRISDRPGANGLEYGLAVAHDRTIQHYKLQKHISKQLSRRDHNRYKFGIQDGLRFEFIAELIEHYHIEADGLCCILKRNVSTMAVEISPRELQMEAGLLGSGEFGEVRKALWRKRAGQGITVAVKVLKVPAGASEAADAEMQAFIDEGKTMVPLKHAFVVKLMGVVQEGQKMLVTEFMPLGAMNKFLKSKQKAGDPLPLQALLLFMKQIAEGMVYLEAQKVVHRDLASRNVLVQSENVCKISDFGMSRQVENYYKSSRVGKWPLKWYAPECMYYSKFTSKGDVWSYGVCSWEILSHGKKPFKGMKGDQVVQYVIEEKGRLACPAICPGAMYDVLQECWTHEMEARPGFVAVCRKVQQIHAAQGRGSSGSTAVVSRSRVMDDQRFYDLENAIDELEVAEQEEQSIYMRHIGSVKGVKSKCTIAESALRLEAELGHGSVGNVLKGSWSSPKGTFAVAVKMVRVGGDYKHKSFLESCDKLAALRHPNLLPFHGLCQFHGGRMGVVLEFQMYDALNKYLAAKKLPPRSSKRFITQIAIGMQYLADKAIIHRDLAARNVLVHSPEQCKISDFSLAKSLGHETEYYRTEQKGLWPIKWYAPECLYSSTFTTYSDVWSFGVTMWEVAQSGKTPYPGMKGRQVLEFIERGNRLKIHPKIIEQEPWMQPLMESCWNTNPRSRPSFKQIVATCRANAPP